MNIQQPKALFSLHGQCTCTSTAAGMVRERTSYDLYDKDSTSAMTSQASAAVPPPQRQHKSSEGSLDSGGYRSSDTLHAGGGSVCRVTSVRKSHLVNKTVYFTYTYNNSFLGLGFDARDAVSLSSGGSKDTIVATSSSDEQRQPGKSSDKQRQPG